MVKKRKYRSLEFEEALEDLADLEADLIGVKKKKKRFITRKSPRNKKQKMTKVEYGPSLPEILTEKKRSREEIFLESVPLPIVVSAVPKGLEPRKAGGRCT